MPSAGKVLQIEDVLTEDNLGRWIAQEYHRWDMLRARKIEEWKELYKYIYATDTRSTSNNVLPWKNTTTTPKLTQIRDNLFANYMQSMFPKRRWLKWEGDGPEDEDKSEAIRAYMGDYVIQYPGFKETISRLVLDYIDNGNCFTTADWLDTRHDAGAKIQGGYVGPIARRLSPYDIVMNPTAPDFHQSPKIVRSLVQLGEVKELLSRLSLNEDERVVNEELFKYMVEVRDKVQSFQGDLHHIDDFYRVDGFTSFRAYLESGYAEILTFYGDLYDRNEDTLLKNYIIQVVDRHLVISKRPNPTNLSRPSIHHSGWRPRQDNLWAMGPLDNLVGLQYRIDHIENNKADFFDLVNFPPLKIRGYVEDFEWGPFSKIYVDQDGDVEVMTPNVNPLQANFEISELERKMEELAGAPKEAMGFRTPGEKTAYEVQRLENAASRIFQAKITQFEEEILEPLLNDMLELAQRKMDPTTIRVIDDEFNAATFMELTPADITGTGRIRPIAARHFAETADRVQTITAFYQSGPGQDPEVRQHLSSIETAKLFEELLDLKDYELVEPYIRLTEQADAQRLMNQQSEDIMMEAETPSGLTPDDIDDVIPEEIEIEA